MSENCEWVYGRVPNSPGIYHVKSISNCTYLAYFDSIYWSINARDEDFDQFFSMPPFRIVKLGTDTKEEKDETSI